MRAGFTPALALILALNGALAATPLGAETQPDLAGDTSFTAPGAKFVRPEIVSPESEAEDPVRRASTLAEEILSAATLEPFEAPPPVVEPLAGDAAVTATLAPAPDGTALDAIEPVAADAAGATAPAAIPEAVVIAATTSAVTEALATIEELRRETIEVRVSVSNQLMEVRYKGELIHEWPVSTARKGKVTPRGSFKPQWLSKNHKSSLYNNAPMPHSIFYSGNYAIHGTNQESKLGRPASAGCVRLSRANAKILFALVQQEGKSRMKVEIVD